MSPEPPEPMNPDLNAFLTSELDAHRAAVASLGVEALAPLARLIEACAAAVRAHGKIVLFGNGGSAADAQHLATELTVRYVGDRAPIPGLALTTDTSALTATGNDFSFDEIFARQVEALCGPADVVIGISTSGNSANVLRGLHAAKKAGCVAAAFGGRDGGGLKGIADPLVIAPADDTARIQELHILMGHMLCAALERELGLI